MKNLRILIVNDFASNASLFQRYLPHKVDVIYFKKNPVITHAENPLFFQKNELSSCVKQIKDLSENYDIFVTFGWIAAAVCYLANVNYSMYFVDSFIDPEYRIRQKPSLLKKNFFDSLFKDTLKHANKIVAAFPNDGKILKKYRNDVKIIFPFVDTKMFHPNNKKINFGYDSFVFFSPQRIDPAKGHEKIFKAIKLTKTNFVVLQTDWGSGDYYEKILQSKPAKVKLIPKIVRSKMPSYYVSTNALLGQFSYSGCGGTEREAILCGIPVFCYESYQYTDNDPFFKSQNPNEIANYVDKIVEDENFRTELVRIQNLWVKKYFDFKKLSNDWNELLENSVNENSNYKVKKQYELALKIYYKF